LGLRCYPHLRRMCVSVFFHGRLVNLHGHIYRHPAPPLLHGGRRPSPAMPPLLHGREPLRRARPHSLAVVGSVLRCHLRYTIVRSGARLHHSSPVVGLRLRCRHHYTVTSLFGVRVHTFSTATLQRVLSPLLGSRRLRPALPPTLHDRALRRTSPFLGGRRPSPAMPPPLHGREPPQLLNGHAPACTSPLLGSCRLWPALLPATRSCAPAYVYTTPPRRSRAPAYAPAVPPQQSRASARVITPFLLSFVFLLRCLEGVPAPVYFASRIS